MLRSSGAVDPETDIFDTWKANHTVHLYEEGDSLLGVAGQYIGGSLVGGRRVVVLSTAARWRDLREFLISNGLELETTKNKGQLKVVDAGEFLDRVSRGDVPDPILFRSCVDELLDEGSGNGRFRGCRIFGEVTDILGAKGNFKAIELMERAWNEMIVERSFTLMCVCSTRAFYGIHSSHDLRVICAAHKDVICG